MPQLSHDARAAEQRARAASFRVRPVRCAIVSVGEALTEETDRSGSLVRQRMRKAGHEIALYKIVPDKSSIIRRGLQELSGKVDTALFCGGTDIDEQTFDVIAGALDWPLPGFSELFRQLLFEQMGPPAMLARATAGVAGGTLFFSVPGALDPVKVALDGLILPDLKHLVWRTVRQKARRAGSQS